MAGDSESTVRGFRGLKVWQLAIEVAKDVYRLTTNLPKHELYGLSSQLRCAAVSIPSNIAEGNKRESTREYLHFISIAFGSLAEMETQLLLAVELDYANPQQVERLLILSDELGKMLSGLRRSLRAKF